MSDNYPQRWDEIKRVLLKRHNQSCENCGRCPAVSEESKCLLKWLRDNAKFLVVILKKVVFAFRLLILIYSTIEHL